jgi:hypothetical protein
MLPTSVIARNRRDFVRLGVPTYNPFTGKR